jgi:hypothetical protein
MEGRGIKAFLTAFYLTNILSYLCIVVPVIPLPVFFTGDEAGFFILYCLQQRIE